jgi:arabinosaccharide transport system substrate-binding protein
MFSRFPYGRAPLWIAVAALCSTAAWFATRGHRAPRPDLVLVTFTQSHYDAYRRAVPAFERAHGVTVQVEFTNWTPLRSRLQNAMLAGTEVPDLAEVFEGSLGFFTRGAARDIGLVDLTDLLRAAGLTDRLVASRFSLWSAQGRLYALPHDVHPVMLAYRRDLVEAAGIDVATLDTWDKFVAAGQRVTRDLDGDGVVDRYMLDLRADADWGLTTLMFQRGGALFDPDGNVAFDSEVVAQTILWYLRQSEGPHKIAYDAGWGQSTAKAMSDGLVLFFITPDWRSFQFEEEEPWLRGKMALMPLPAWAPGERRTSVWGGTGLMMMKATRRPDLAWELAKYLYFDTASLGTHFAETNLIPVLKDAWTRPELDAPNPYYSNQRIGRMYAALAPDTPPVYSSAVDAVARAKLNEAYSRCVEKYRRDGEAGLLETIRGELARAAADVRRMADRNRTLTEGEQREAG